MMTEDFLILPTFPDFKSSDSARLFHECVFPAKAPASQSDPETFPRPVLIRFDS